MTTKITSLERDLIDAALSQFMRERSARLAVVDSLAVKERRFSSSDNRTCVGFYTHFQENAALKSLSSVLPRCTIDAQHPDLNHKMAGFILFCGESTKAIELLEGYFYGDDTLPISELLMEKHRFVVKNATDL